MLRFVVAGTSAGEMQMAERESPFPKPASFLARLLVAAAVGWNLGWVCQVDYCVWSFHGSWLPHSMEAFG